MTRHLIIGASGQIGEQLFTYLKQAGETVVGTCYQHARPDLSPLDIRDATAVHHLFQQLEPEIIFLPAALTNVDYCEQHPREAYEHNVLGPCNVVNAARQHNAKIVYFSSDYVFDGDNGPYTELAPARPICLYGQNKLLSEHYLALHAPTYLIIRTTVVYGWESQGKNFIQRLVEKLRQGERLSVPYDQIGSPTYAPNLVAAVMELVNQNAHGLFHVAGPKLATRYDLAVTAAQLFNLDATLITPVSTADLKQAAARPLKAGMLVHKAQRQLQTPLLDYVAGLTLMATPDTQRGTHVR